MPKFISAALASVCYLACLVAPVLYFLGYVGTSTYRTLLLAGSLGWFVFATAWATGKGGDSSSEPKTGL